MDIDIHEYKLHDGDHYDNYDDVNQHHDDDHHHNY